MLRTVLAALVLVAAVPASAQLVNRSKEPAKDTSKDKKADSKSGDDDDILAPKDGAKGTDTPADASKPKSYAVGLVGVVPIGDAGKSAADKATQGLAKELGAGHVFDVAAL